MGRPKTYEYEIITAYRNEFGVWKRTDFPDETLHDSINECALDGYRVITVSMSSNVLVYTLEREIDS